MAVSTTWCIWGTDDRLWRGTGLALEVDWHDENFKGVYGFGDLGSGMPRQLSTVRL
jgi:hypothetical protein